MGELDLAIVVGKQPRLGPLQDAEFPSLEPRGVAAADAICTAEAVAGGGANSSGLKAAALLVDETGCAGLPCRRASLHSWSGQKQIDWPLKPNATYNRLDNVSAVGFTNAHALLAWPLYLGATPDALCDRIATGLASDWTTHHNGTCGNWKNATARLPSWGLSCSRLPELVADPSARNEHVLCADSFHLLCVTLE